MATIVRNEFTHQVSFKNGVDDTGNCIFSLLGFFFKIIYFFSGPTVHISLLSKDLISSFNECIKDSDSRCHFVDGTFNLVHGCQLVLLGVEPLKGFLKIIHF